MTRDESTGGEMRDEPPEARSLRARAEERAKREAPGWPGDIDPVDVDAVRRMVQDLRVHQIELEIQNEELRDTEARLDEARARYFDLYNLAPVGYLTLDDTARIIEANLTGAKLLGEQRSDLAARPFSDFVAPADQDSWYHCRRRLRETGREQVELELHRGDGTGFYARLDLTRIRKAEGRGVTRAVLSDVSERRQHEQEKLRLDRHLRKIQKAEGLHIMAAGIVHHFNNLLCVIQGNLELGIEDLPEGSERMAILTDALDSAVEAGTTSKLLLTYLGQLDGEAVPAALSAVCRRTLPALRKSAPSNMELEDSLPTPGPTVAVVPGQIELLLSALVTNAFEATDEGMEAGLVRVSIRTVERDRIPSEQRFPLDWTPEHESYACLTVADPGAGIEPDMIEQVFDPFFSTRSFGRGLGLPVALGVARGHGGAIVVRGGPEAQSALEVYLPLSGDPIPE